MLTASVYSEVSPTGTELIIHDTTDYSHEPKDTFSARIVKIALSDGTLFPNGLPVPFAFSDYPTDIITIPNLKSDMAFSVTLELTSNAPVPGSTYKKTITVAGISFLKNFLFGILQEIAADPTIYRKANFASNFAMLLVYEANVKNALIVNSLTSAQNALTSAARLINNKNQYF